MRKIIIAICGLLIFISGFAQQQQEFTPVEKLEQQVQTLDKTVKKQQKLKVSGLIQTQFQHGEKDAALKVGTANENKEKAFNRIGVRRGFLKMVYDEGIASGVFQINITEQGFTLKDAYLNIKIPHIGASAICAGVFNRPFGYEISYSSSQLESPERALVIQTLFPEERDLGAMLVLQAAKTSAWNFLKLEAGLFAGNGIKPEIDNRKDFIGHLSANKVISNNLGFGLGVSYYNGGVYQGKDSIYTMRNKIFVLNSNTSNKGAFAKREYIGFDAQLSIKSLLGTAKLHGEYIWGTQPGSSTSSKSPNASTLPSVNTYIRSFVGGYIFFVQSFGTLPLSAVLKYDWYDPNVKTANSETGLNGTNRGDIAYQMFGMGLFWNVNSNVRVQAYYDIINNETSDNLAGYTGNLQDNLFTLRLQYKF